MSDHWRVKDCQIEVCRTSTLLQRSSVPTVPCPGPTAVQRELAVCTDILCRLRSCQNQLTGGPSCPTKVTLMYGMWLVLACPLLFIKEQIHIGRPKESTSIMRHLCNLQHLFPCNMLDFDVQTTFVSFCFWPAVWIHPLNLIDGFLLISNAPPT